jgi:hypothetical protein
MNKHNPQNDSKLKDSKKSGLPKIISKIAPPTVQHSNILQHTADSQNMPGSKLPQPAYTQSASQQIAHQQQQLLRFSSNTNESANGKTQK